MKNTTRYVGLDVHKDTIAVAFCDSDESVKVENYGVIENSEDALLKVMLKLKKDDSYVLKTVYEAGPTGFGLCRFLQSKGISCCVVAPSLIPNAPGDKIKTDRKDAEKLCKFYKGHLLTPIYVPDESTEALRNLIRFRHEVKVDEVRNKNRISMFLLRLGVRPPDDFKTTKSIKYRAWLNSLKFEQTENQIVFDSLLSLLRESTDRLSLIDGSIVKCVESYSNKALIDALQSLRGISLLTAVTIVSEIEDFTRFKTAQYLIKDAWFMKYVGVTPKEHSSGQKSKRGSITKTGNSLVRHVLIESAHHYRFQPYRGKTLIKRQENLSQDIVDISWQVKKRLHEKYRHLSGRLGKQKAIVAVSRELAGFIWSIAKEVNKNVDLSGDEEIRYVEETLENSMC